MLNESRYGELLSKYQPKIIKDEAENERALAIVEELIHRPSRNSEENELYELLIFLIETFKQEFYQLAPDSNSHVMLHVLKALGTDSSALV